MNTPVSVARSIARDYCFAYGLPDPVQGHYVPVDETLAREIAAAYETLPVRDPDARAAYEQLAREVSMQYAWAQDMGIEFQAWTGEGQPYANSAEMCADVRDNGHLYYFTGGEPHPGLDAQTNEQFRAVHDLFGHAAEGFQFGPRGEENAWIHHSMMFTPLAQRALSTETRGQNSWVNYGPHSSLPVCERPYATQKLALLPERLTDWRAALAR